MAFFSTIIFNSILIELSVGFNMAVVEYSPKKNDGPLNTILENINEYRIYLENNRHRNVDVMVFPEYGLTGFVEDVENYAIEINKKSKVINELSAMSSKYNINMVVNLLEKLEDSDIYCNTNIVLNEKGVIIAKYRKINLNPETESKLTAGNEVVEFTLEGRHFSTITNDDILFEYPTNNFSDYVSHVAIPMNWENTGPLNIATGLQAAYSEKTGKIVLAANINDPDKHKSGSGLYCLNESDSFITEKKVNQIILSDEKRTKRQEFNLNIFDEILHNIEDFINKEHQFTLYDMISEDTLASNDLRCYIKFPFNDEGIEPLIPTGYLSGYRNVTINGRLYEIRSCAFLACPEFALEECKRKHINNKIEFKDILMQTNLNFEKSYPIAFDADLRPIENVNWMEKNGEVLMKVENNSQILNVFAIVEYTPIEYETKLLQLPESTMNVREKSDFLKISVILLSIIVFVLICVFLLYFHKKIKEYIRKLLHENAKISKEISNINDNKNNDNYETYSSKELKNLFSDTKTH